jgi:hypothetical protein
MFDPDDLIDTGLAEAAAYVAVSPQHGTPAPNVSTKQLELASETMKAAENYVRVGWKTFPGKRGHRDHRDKEPKAGWSWTKEHLTLADIPIYFGNNQHNVLVALGEISGNLIDVDLDWPEAAAAADVIFKDLPSFGRSGKPRSHRLAICNVKNQKYLLPQSLANHPKVTAHQEHKMCIAEARGSGSYTVFPGSAHQTGQKIEWTNLETDNIAAIPTIQDEALLRQTGLLCFTAFCMRFFPAIGARCDFMMAVAGALARAGYEPALVQEIVQRIGAFNHDDGDKGAWRVGAQGLSGKIQGGKEVTGLPSLIKILGFGDDVEKWCRERLGTQAEAADGDWPDGQFKNGNPKRGILNTTEALKRAGVTCTWDDFRQKEYWHGHEDKSFDGEVSDASVTITRRNLDKNFNLFPSAQGTRDAVTCACRDNKSDPVLGYFAGLKWDGKPRLEKMLHVYLGAPDTLLNSAIGLKVMCAIVRRTKEPGCKYDQQLVIQGPQGAMKSTFCEDLAVFRDLYTDTGDLSGSIKDQMDIIQGKQIIEFPELAGYGRASREHNKAMLSRKVDRSRLSYGRYATDAPRRSVPIATTNEQGFLTDPTGERRFWNFTMIRYDRDAFLGNKDQLYAEAVVREPNEKLWLDTPELKAAHDAVVATAKAPDELVDQLADLVGEIWNVDGEKEERVSVADITAKLGLSKVDTIRLHGFGRRLADAMKTLGWRKAPKNLRCHKGSSPTAGYSRPWVEPEAADADTEASADMNTAEDVGLPGEADIALDERLKKKLLGLPTAGQPP